MAHQLILLLSRLGIRARVLGGFALTLVFLIGLASLAVTQMGLLGGTVDTLVLSAEGDAGMSGVRLAMVSANVSAEHFIRTRNLGDLSAAKGSIDRLEAAFKDAAAKFASLPAVASSKDGLAQQIADYHAAFDAVSAAVDKVRVATAKTEAVGAAAGLQAAAITAGLVNEPLQAGAPEAALLPPATDTLRAALAHYTLTAAKSDANEAHLALGFVASALASYQKQSGQLDARMQKLTGLLQTSAGDDDKALADLEAANAGLMEAQARFTKASDAIDKGIAGISSSLGASRTEQGVKTAQEVDSTRGLVMMVAAGAVIVGAFLAWLIGRSVSGPLLKITARMQSLAAGDLDRAIPGGDHHDEIGRMATAIEVFRENALAVRRMEAGAAAEREAAEANRRRLMLELADRFERGVEGVIHSVTESTRHMGVSAHELAKLAEEGRQLAESVAARSEQASGNVQTVSAATQ
jgi:HAMP domain-containing protein